MIPQNKLKKCFVLSITAVSLVLGGCATTRYDSACHELASVAESEIEDKVERANGGTFERHLILLETGTEISSNCRTHFIDKVTYESIPESLVAKCKAQSRGNDKYCILYSLDGETKKVRVY